MVVKIGSFNVRNLSASKGFKRDLKKIAKFINYYQLDIVCLQEVLSEGKILKGFNVNGANGQAAAYNKSLMGHLTGKWDCQWAMPHTSRELEKAMVSSDTDEDDADVRGEGYAILWRTDKGIELAKKDGVERRPDIYANGYDSTIAGSMLRLIRDPLEARFKIKGKKVELRVLSTHVIYAKSKSLKDVIDYGAIEMRRKEFYILAGQIYQKVNKDGKSPKAIVPYTILLGDYNLNIGSSLPDTLVFDKDGHVLNNDVTEIDENDGTPFVIRNYQNEKTTIKRDTAEMANSYDHFTYDDRMADLVVPDSCRAVDLIHKYSSASDKTEEELFATYFKDVSDHIPIIITLNL